MKILITGGCGFIGSNLAIFLKQNIRNAKITSVDNLSRKGSSLNHKIYRLKKPQAPEASSNKLDKPGL